jgi:hypothetical protein
MWYKSPCHRRRSLRPSSLQCTRRRLRWLRHDHIRFSKLGVSCEICIRNAAGSRTCDEYSRPHRPIDRIFKLDRAVSSADRLHDASPRNVRPTAQLLCLYTPLLVISAMSKSGRCTFRAGPAVQHFALHTCLAGLYEHRVL